MQNFQGFLFAAILVSSTLAHAGHTELRFDMTGDRPVGTRLEKINIAKLNKTLAKNNLEGLPERIVVGATDKPYWRLLMRRIEAANKALGEEMDFVIDQAYFHELSNLCYRGEASEVPGIIRALSGTFFHGDQGILGIRYGSTTTRVADELKSEEAFDEYYEGNHKELKKKWFGFRATSKNVLVMSNLGPQGDGLELYATTIRPCKVGE